MRAHRRFRLHAARSDVAPWLLLWALAFFAVAGPTSAQGGEPEEAAESNEPVELEAQEPGDAGLVPLFDPDASAPVPLFDPDSAPALGVDPDLSRAPGPAVDPNPLPAEPTTVPLFDPDAPAGMAGSAGRGGVDADGFVELFDPDADPEWQPAPAPGGSGGGAFDFEAARRMLAAEMTSPADIAAPEDVLEVVEAGELDADVGAVALRGADEYGLDLRSVERFRWECRNEISRRDVTLFANGTVRLRSGPRLQPELQLDELSREELLGYLSRLARIQRSQAVRHDVAGAEDFGQLDGELGESCRVQLRLPDLPRVSLDAPRLEVPQLGLAQLVAIAEELASFTEPLQLPAQVATSYRPSPGDLLKRRDGYVYRVVGLTTGGSGVELEGLQEPIRIFYRLEDLPSLFERFDGVWDGEPVAVGEPEVREIVDIGGEL
ncbi:MAG: hypothetical protein AAGM22_19815 [Acidobacteriota bacterium]